MNTTKSTTHPRTKFDPLATFRTGSAGEPPEPAPGSVIVWETGSYIRPRVAIRHGGVWRVTGAEEESTWAQLLDIIGPDQWRMAGVTVAYRPLVDPRPEFDPLRDSPDLGVFAHPSEPGAGEVIVWVDTTGERVPTAAVRDHESWAVTGTVNAVAWRNLLLAIGAHDQWKKAGVADGYRPLLATP